jgi:hypothetical protein
MVSCGIGVHWKCVLCPHIIIHPSIHPQAWGGWACGCWFTLQLKWQYAKRDLISWRYNVQQPGRVLAEVQSTIYPLEEQIYVKSSTTRSFYTFSLFQRDWLLVSGQAVPSAPTQQPLFLTILGQLVIFWGPLHCFVITYHPLLWNKIFPHFLETSKAVSVWHYW